MKRLHNHQYLEQHQALTPGGVKEVMRHPLGILIICATMFTSGLARANDDASIVVPRDFPTIQAAVDGAAPGATIKVQAGTYTEEIAIAKKLTIKGAGIGKTIIKPPLMLTPFAEDLRNGKPVTAIVRITDGADVKLSKFTLSGPIPCGTDGGGIRAVDGATVNLSDTYITGIRPAENGTCIPGDALGASISIGLPPFILFNDAFGTNGHATITHVTIDRFLTSGIVVVGPPGETLSTATISHNVITGGSPFPVLGQNGISVNLAAVARVSENTVRGTVCTDPACGRDPINQFQSSGIGTTFAEVPGTVFKDNTVIGTDIGIYVLGNAGCCETHENRIKDNRFFGILIQDGSNDTAQNNISGGEVGIGVVADTVDTTAVLRKDKISGTSVLPVQELSCCGFTATAIVEDH